MHSWLWWFLLALFVVLPVALRLLAGDDEPDNAIEQEQENPPHKPAEMRLAA